MVGRDGKETPIQDAKYKDGDLSFTVVRETNGQKMTIKKTGKVSGDTIKGKTEFERDGQTQSRGLGGQTGRGSEPDRHLEMERHVRWADTGR